MKERFGIRQISGIAILTALIAVIQYIANLLPVGYLPYNLTLFPIALGAVMYGPLAGLFLGLIGGGLVLVAPSTAAFLAFNPVATVFLCLLKTGIAGLVAGLIYIPFRKKNHLLGSILASLSVPTINTGMFIIASFFIFAGAFKMSIGWEYLAYIFVALVGLNFFIELAINSVLSPVLFKIYEIASRRFNIGVRA